MDRWPRPPEIRHPRRWDRSAGRAYNQAVNSVATGRGAVRQRMHRDRLSARWLVGGIGGLLLAAGGMGAIAAATAGARTAGASESTAGPIASEGASRLSAWLAEVGNEVNDYAAAVVLDRGAGPAELATTFQTLLTGSGDFLLLELADPSGRVIAASSGSGRNLAATTWLHELSATPLITPITGNGGTVSWFVARLATTGRYSGILAAELQVSQVADLLGPLARTGGTGTEIEAVLPGGVLLYRSTMTTTLHAGLTGAAMLADGALSARVSSPGVSAALAGRSGVTRYATHGTPVASGYAGVTLPGWTIGIVTTQDLTAAAAPEPPIWMLPLGAAAALAGIGLLTWTAVRRGLAPPPMPRRAPGVPRRPSVPRRRPDGTPGEEGVSAAAAPLRPAGDEPTVVHRGPAGVDDRRGGRRRIRGRYEILDVCGRGGEGQVLRALDHLHGRQVAIKVRHLDPHAVARRREILNEASVLLRMTPHPSASVVREDFIAGDRYYLVMDWIDGTPLSRVLAERGAPGLPAPTVLHWMDQVASVLDHLHAHTPPIVHGDIKPSNVIVTAGREERAILVDFGISQRRETAAPPSGAPSHPDAVGSPGFMAPELLRGVPATAASDVFGLAATAFTLLLGEPPRLSHAPDWRGIADGASAGLLAAAFKAGLAVDPARRHPSAGEFVAAVRSAIGGLDAAEARTAATAG